jgi:hypothetical protein
MTTDTNRDSFDQDFCSHLEYHLCRTFKNSPDKDIQNIWCDGVSDQAFVKTKKYVNDNRRLQTKAWIGKDGQDEFEMTIVFGNKALSKYARGLDLKDCLPSDVSMNWVEIHLDKKTIELRLD